MRGMTVDELVSSKKHDMMHLMCTCNIMESGCKNIRIAAARRIKATPLGMCLSNSVGGRVDSRLVNLRCV